MNAVKNFKNINYPLHSVALKEWEGFIFINLAEKPTNFEIYFSPILNRFKQFSKSNEWLLKIIQTSTKKRPTIGHKSTKMVPGSDSKLSSVPNPQKVAPSFMRATPFWHHLVDFGRFWEATSAPKSFKTL